MATTIWSGLNANLIRYDVSYDASRPDPYGDQVNITFHLHTYKRDGSVSFNYDLVWDAMWCMGTNWSGGQQIKGNNVAMGEYWNDCHATVHTANNYVTGVRFIAGSRRNDGSSGKYDTGSDINISVPAKQTQNVPAKPPNDGAIFSTNNSNGVHRGTIKDNRDTQVWWDWWGQSSGQPDANVIAEYAVDISKTNDSSTASSIAGRTHPYNANTRIDLSSLMSHYGVSAGQTLYCWVNTRTRGDSWLGRQYLGAIQIIEGNAPDIDISTNTQKISTSQSLTLKWTDLAKTDYHFSNYIVQVKRYDSANSKWTDYSNIHDLYNSYPASFATTVTTTNVVIGNLYKNIRADDRFSFRVGVTSDSRVFYSTKSVGVYTNLPKERGLLYKSNGTWIGINRKNRKLKGTTTKSDIKIDVVQK